MITIKPLQTDQAQLFTAYFDGLDFSHAEHWAGCFCQYYLSGCTPEEWEQRSASQNRELALLNIRSGRMTGYLAFEGQEVVGWCRTIDMLDAPNIANLPELPTARGEAGAVVCFVVHPRTRGQGLAGQLLGVAVEGFRRDGYQKVYGFPFESKEHPQRQYLGTAGMFERLGFSRQSASENQAVYCLEF